MTALFVAVSGLAVLGLLYCGVQILAVRVCLRRNDEDRDGGSAADQMSKRFCPPVSILKPLKGLDDNLFANLESFCNQDYPEYEIVFSVGDENDPACKVARKIRYQYPQRKISLVVKECKYGLNPKINVVVPAYRASQFEYILISDSNVMVDRNYLTETVKHMEDADVGLVTNLIRGVGSGSVGSLLENLHLNSFVIGNICVLERFLKRPCVVGKSMLMRKDALEEIGGFAAVRNILAEDYIIGTRMHQRGRKVIVSGHLIDNVNEYRTVRTFISRHTRWGKLRWRIAGAAYLAEIMSNAVFIGYLSLVLFGATKLSLSLAVFVSISKMLGDYYLGRTIGSPYKIIHYCLSPIKDIIIGLIWFVPLFSRSVIWRGAKFKVGKDTVQSPARCSGHEDLR